MEHALNINHLRAIAEGCNLTLDSIDLHPGVGIIFGDDIGQIPRLNFTCQNTRKGTLARVVSKWFEKASEEKALVQSVLDIFARKNADEPYNLVGNVRNGGLWIVSSPQKSVIRKKPSFKTWYEETFQVMLPKLKMLSPRIHLGGTLWGSLRGVQWAREHNMFGCLPPPEGSEDLSVAGFAGYGVNSYAVYLISYQGVRKRYLRLIYGGVYCSDEDGEAVTQSFNALAEIDKFSDFIAAEDIYCNMGDWKISYKFRNGMSLRSQLPIYKCLPHILEAMKLPQVDQFETLDSRSCPALLFFTDDGKESRFNLLPKLNNIGRAGSNDLILTDSTVSLYHTVITWLNGTPHLINLSTSNGTTVNGRRVDKHPLREFDQINLGRIRLIYTERPENP